MDYYLAFFFLAILLGVTGFVFLTRVLIPIYKLYQENLQLK